MASKIVEVACGVGFLDTVLSAAEQAGAATLAVSRMDGVERCSARLLVEGESAQVLLDALQRQLPPEGHPIILVEDVDTLVAGAAGGRERSDVAVTREELYAEIRNGASLDGDFVLLTVLATVVAAIGLAEDSVAAVIGAMVIAPLLGPNLGLALGAALGDRELIRETLLTNAVGVSVTVALAALVAVVWPPSLESIELLARTEVQMSSIVLALASGVAAVHSFTSRASSVLVGVMVAVALLPPATVLGMMLGMGEQQLALGSGLLLAVNVVALNLSAQAVFLFEKVRPRTWYAQRAASQSSRVNLFVWALLLGLVTLLVYVHLQL